MRLDKYIANHSSWSRSEVKRLIKQGRVRVNEQAADDKEQKIDALKDRVVVDETPILAQGKHYFVLHKPSNVVCANSHPDYPTVLDLMLDISPALKNTLQIAGRLDVDTTGLVLITDDGQWNHRVTSPRSDCYKIYEVELAEDFNESYVKDFERGMLLEGEEKPTLPANLKKIHARKFQLSLKEGRYHQVKRMFAFTGNKVIRLHRRSIGPLQLDEHLPEGAYRSLTEKEIQALAGNYNA